MKHFDLTTWNPQDLAVLCFIREQNSLLLIHKKRGLGAGKINAPGGKCEAGEQPIDTAIRETREEVCVTPVSLTEHGTLRFAFSNGYQLEGRIFIADGFHGIPQETDEAAPFWCRIEDIPYKDMWEDDILWLPYVLTGGYIEANFTFDGDRMTSHTIRECGLPGESFLDTPAIDRTYHSPEICNRNLVKLQQAYSEYRNAQLPSPASNLQIQLYSSALNYLLTVSENLGLVELSHVSRRLLQHFHEQSTIPGYTLPQEISASLDFYYLRAISMIKEQTFQSMVL